MKLTLKLFVLLIVAILEPDFSRGQQGTVAEQFDQNPNLSAVGMKN